MSFNNTDYLYDHLPARFRRDDKGDLLYAWQEDSHADGLLYRFLQIFGGTLDDWDEKYDNFYQLINPATAPLEWIIVWLKVLFGWSFFPWWFTLTDKRRLYGNFARHLARRGTATGIEKFLKDFGIVARVHTRAVTWGEFVWGESSFSIANPLYIVIEIFYVESPPTDASFLSEGAFGEMFYSTPRQPITEAEILELVRYQQPHAQEIDVFWRLSGYESVNFDPYWEQISW